MKKWYFTFSLNDHFPYQGGWVIVEAETEHKARKIFNEKYPPFENGLLRCAFVYSEEEFMKTTMAKEGNYDAWCHEVIKEGGSFRKVWLIIKSETQPQYMYVTSNGWPAYPEANNVVHSAYLHREDAERERNLLSASYQSDTDGDDEEEKPEVYFWISGIEVQEV